MPWKIRLLDKSPENPQIGDAWYAHEMINEFREFYLKNSLSVEYKQNHLNKRSPIIVHLPMRYADGSTGSFPFCVDEGYKNGGHISEHGWTVSGELPNITVNPSINCIGIYHGWIRNGEISDDCEGRKF